MGRAFKLPDLGEGIHEGEIVDVRVSVGDTVREGDIILEISTDKATVEIPSPYTGTVESIQVRPGDLVNVGDVMITFSPGEADVVFREGTRPEKPVFEPVPELLSKDAPRERRHGPVPASPATRRLARELDVDLRLVTPTGPSGLVTAEDVRRHADTDAAGPSERDNREKRPPDAVQPRLFSVAAESLPDFSKWGAVHREPLRGIRRATARQMTLSWSQIPHVNSQDSVDITLLEELRKRRKISVAEAGGKLSITAFVLKSAAAALKKYPQFNVSLDAGAGEIVYKSYCHIGVAVDTPKGLIVPVVRDVDRKSLIDLSVEMVELVNRTREGKISLEALQGGTFTITNAGAMGGAFFSPIINYPEAAILGMGQARWQPVIRTSRSGEHRIVPRLMMPMVVCVDHRLLDGADAIKFLGFLKKMLEEPEEMLMNIV